MYLSLCVVVVLIHPMEEKEILVDIVFSECKKEIVELRIALFTLNTDCE